MADSNQTDILQAPLESKQQLVYEQFKQDILNNIYPEGTVLAERRLCAIYNVSRSPIRNAIQQLAHEGLLTLIPGKGVAVAAFTIEDILEVYDLIETLELYALRSFPANDEYFLDRLKISLDSMNQCMQEQKLDEAARWDRQFHRILIRASSNKRLNAMYEPLDVQSMRLIATTVDDKELAGQSYQDHLAIYRFLLECSPQQAQAALQHHYKNIKQYYIKKLINRIQP